VCRLVSSALCSSSCNRIIIAIERTCRHHKKKSPFFLFPPLLLITIDPKKRVGERERDNLLTSPFFIGRVFRSVAVGMVPPRQAGAGRRFLHRGSGINIAREIFFARRGLGRAGNGRASAALRGRSRATRWLVRRTVHPRARVPCATGFFAAAIASRSSLIISPSHTYGRARCLTSMAWAYISSIVRTNLCT
jgi:hypothetical protein